MMERRNSCCVICENSNHYSICAPCVNYSLHEYWQSLKSLKSVRDSSYDKINEALIEKNKAEEQLNWRMLQREKLAQLKQKLHTSKKRLSQGKASLEKISNDLKFRSLLLESAFTKLRKTRIELIEKYFPNLICNQNLRYMAVTSERLHKQSMVLKQICKLYPLRRVTSNGDTKDGHGGQYDQICNARLPRGLDPHSVPPTELAASLGYMVHLLNLVVEILGSPVLYNTGFAGSCSRIWQRNSYWNARPSSPSNEYPLFIPRQNGENLWPDRNSSNFGIASMDSERKADVTRTSSFDYSIASTHSLETHKDLQKGISLLKKSVACVTAFCYNSLCLDVPSDTSTFEAFAKLLATLSSSKEVRSLLHLKMACTRYSRKAQQVNQSMWRVNSDISSSSLGESTHTAPTMRSTSENNLVNSTSSFFYTADAGDNAKLESLVEGWDIVEHPTLPPPSQIEDIEHWTRAMIIDATKR